MKKAILVLSAVLLVSCASIQSDAFKEPVLFNPYIGPSALEVSVMSNGCTKAEHFYLVVSGNEAQLRRTKDDLCRAAPRLVRFEFDYAFGNDAYELVNEVRYSNRLK